MVCITLAFGLGYIGLTLTGGCWACTYGAAHVRVKRIAKLKNEKRLYESILPLLDRRIWRALCNASEVNGKRIYGLLKQRANPADIDRTKKLI
jgi:hypothetical protein